MQGVVEVGEIRRWKVQVEACDRRWHACRTNLGEGRRMEGVGTHGGEGALNCPSHT